MIINSIPFAKLTSRGCSHFQKVYCKILDVYKYIFLTVLPPSLANYIKYIVFKITGKPKYISENVENFI